MKNMTKKELLKRIRGNTYGLEAKTLVDAYLTTPITIDIEDKNIERVCQVLTNYGYKTVESCEGHDKNLPKIWFECLDQYHLRHLAFVVSGDIRASPMKFPWILEATSNEAPELDRNMPLLYCLMPWGAYFNKETRTREVIDPERDGKDLLYDLDLIGLSVMAYFQKHEK